MFVIAGIGFTAPWLLAALVALPILWLILRAIPPAPQRVSFAGVTLLRGLGDDEATTAHTPWWLLLLRIMAIGAIILGLAGPVLNPQTPSDRNGPVVFVWDATWAGAPNWPAKQAYVTEELDQLAQSARPVAMLRLTAPEPLQFQTAADWQSRLVGIAPEPWQPDADALNAAMDALQLLPDDADVQWISDGLDYVGRDGLLDMLSQTTAAVTVVTPTSNTYGLRPSAFRDGLVDLTVLRSLSGPSEGATILAIGRDPAGAKRVLSSADATFTAGNAEAQVQLSLPSELRARITRFEIQGHAGAGATTLTDDSLRRREVALFAGREDREGLELLSPLHYLRRALAPVADLIDGPLDQVLPANPDVVILADVARLTPADASALEAWVENGGLLLRFAGPRLAASDVSRESEDPLMPVRLRIGGRSVGGAMSWGAPKSLAPFDESSPFFGLPIPDDVTVTSQVVAQPDPTLADRVIAQLADGTPLVTRKTLGAGSVVLVHVTANAEWSTLPLSGMFVQMLERLAVSTSATQPDADDLVGTTWTPVSVLDGFGRVLDAATLAGVDGEQLVTAPIGPNLRPGLYDSGDRQIARNVLDSDDTLAAASWPAGTTVTGLDRQTAQSPLGGWLLSLALMLLAADVLATLALSGRLFGTLGNATATVVAALLLALPAPQARAQEATTDLRAPPIEAATGLVLAHVLTGDASLDNLAAAGLRGLSNTLNFRTSVEPASPIGVDLERDELALFPVLYWPISADQPIPSDAAYARLNAYLRTGGMIIFDTRDAGLSGYGSTTAEARKLQRLAQGLDIPALEPIPNDHVLTRAFYLLQDFPGRHVGPEVWVEAAPPDAESVEGMPFRNLNDGVTPVIVGGNDWASAWAVDDIGAPLLPVGRGYAGERQRELAHRFGVNLVMYALSGNYKSDQVHVPALLERLGQ